MQKGLTLQRQEIELAAPTYVSIDPVQQVGLPPIQPSNLRMAPVLSNESPPSADQFLKGRHARRQRVPSRQWEKHRELIKSLYVNEDKTLTATRQVMKDEHGFDASYVTCILHPQHY